MTGIQIQELTKRFGDNVALQNVSLTFQPGKIYGLLGRNGAGKSTLLGIAANRLFADSGQVLIDGEPACENDRAQKKLYMMSEKNLYPKDMRVRDVFRWSERFYGSFDRQQAQVLAQQFGLNTKKRVKELSTGYTSIFKLIVALCLDVPYLFLDEPVLGLDANHREMFYHLLLKNYADEPRTIIIATHLIEEVANLIEEIAIIDKGRLLMSQSVQSLLDSGYCVSGKAGDVDAYAAGKKVIGEDVLGGLKTAYILGGCDRQVLCDSGLELSKLNLQKLFVELTKKEGEQ